MSRKTPVNMPASIAVKLHNLARKDHQDYNYLLRCYASERFLYRLSISPYSENFILKGSSLFIIWQNGKAYRHTMDDDLLCLGESGEDFLKKSFSEICALGDINDDGMAYDSESIDIEPIRLNNEYGGVGITLNAFLGSANVHLKFDIGIGDAITPKPRREQFPVLLNGANPILRIYPKETVIAEKLHAMITHGEQNSRMKDFADLYMLASKFEFNYEDLRLAIMRTFDRRRTPNPPKCPLCFSDAFAKEKQTQWVAFLRRDSLFDCLPSDFSLVIEQLSTFLLPVIMLSEQKPHLWDPNNCWHK